MREIVKVSLLAIFFLAGCGSDGGGEALADRSFKRFEFNFDFEDEAQLVDLPSFGDDPSYIESGVLVCPILEGEHKGLGRKFWLDGDGVVTDEADVSFDLYIDQDYQLGTHESETGKFIGFEGIYDESAGWGGRPVTDQKSWSVRIANTRQNDQGEIPIGLYVYHPGMSGQYGTTVDAGFSLKTGQQYEIKLSIKLNDVDRSNGVLEMYVDGRKVYSSNEWVFRLDDSVHVRSVWLDAYIGGETPSPVPTYLSLDNLKIRWREY